MHDFHLNVDWSIDYFIPNTLTLSNSTKFSRFKTSLNKLLKSEALCLYYMPCRYLLKYNVILQWVLDKGNQLAALPILLTTIPTAKTRNIHVEKFFIQP